MSSSLLSLLAAPISSLPAAPIPPGCPWHTLSLYGLPNVNWCEESLCSYIGEPGNAWSNLAYLVAALLVYRLLRGRSLRLPLAALAPSLVIVGVASFVYHASNVFVTQLLDFLGMYLLAGLLLGLNLVRLGWLSSARLPLALGAAVLSLTAITAVAGRFGVPIQGCVALLILGVIGSELGLRFRAAQQSVAPCPLGYFAASFALLLSGALSSALDARRLWCQPQSHVLSGHALWHVLSAASLLLIAFHYRQPAAQPTT